MAVQIPADLKNPFKKSCEKCQVEENVADIDRMVRRMELLEGVARKEQRMRILIAESLERMILGGNDSFADGPMYHRALRGFFVITPCPLWGNIYSDSAMSHLLTYI